MIYVISYHNNEQAKMRSEFNHFSQRTNQENTNSGALADKRFPYFIFTIIAHALSSDETNSGSLVNVSLITFIYFVCNSNSVSTNNVDS